MITLLQGPGVLPRKLWEWAVSCRGLGVSVFQCPLSMLYTVLSSEASPALCSPQIRGGHRIVSVFFCVVHRNFRDTGHWFANKCGIKKLKKLLIKIWSFLKGLSIDTALQVIIQNITVVALCSHVHTVCQNVMTWILKFTSTCTPKINGNFLFWK